MISESFFNKLFFVQLVIQNKSSRYGYTDNICDLTNFLRAGAIFEVPFFGTLIF